MKHVINFFLLPLYFWIISAYDLAPDQPVEIRDPVAFEAMVVDWSKQLAQSVPSVVVSEEASGNCLPVAMELQNRIIASGRMARIVAVGYPGTEVGHAMVMYNSVLGEDYDSVIDNGYETFHVVQPRDFLETDVFGEYLGTCADPNPVTGFCKIEAAY